MLFLKQSEQLQQSQELQISHLIQPLLSHFSLRFIFRCFLPAKQAKAENKLAKVAIIPSCFISKALSESKVSGRTKMAMDKTAYCNFCLTGCFILTTSALAFCWLVSQENDGSFSDSISG